MTLWRLLPRLLQRYKLTAPFIYTVTSRSWFDLLYNWHPSSKLLLNNSLLELIHFLNKVKSLGFFFFLFFLKIVCRVTTIFVFTVKMFSLAHSRRPDSSVGKTVGHTASYMGSNRAKGMLAKKSNIKPCGMYEWFDCHLPSYGGFT